LEGIVTVYGDHANLNELPVTSNVNSVPDLSTLYEPEHKDTPAYNALIQGTPSRFHYFRILDLFIPLSGTPPSPKQDDDMLSRNVVRQILDYENSEQIRLPLANVDQLSYVPDEAQPTEPPSTALVRSGPCLLQPPHAAHHTSTIGMLTITTNSQT